MRRRMTHVFLTLALVVVTIAAICAAEAGKGGKSTRGQDEGSDLKLSPTQPPELGKVGWRRDFAEALEEARKKDRPLLALFQEVPG